MTGMGIELRKLAPEDVPSLLNLWRDAGLTIRPQGREHPDTPPALYLSKRENLDV